MMNTLIDSLKQQLVISNIMNDKAKIKYLIARIDVEEQIQKSFNDGLDINLLIEQRDEIIVDEIIRRFNMNDNFKNN